MTERSRQIEIKNIFNLLTKAYHTCFSHSAPRIVTSIEAFTAKVALKYPKELSTREADRTDVGKNYILILFYLHLDQ
jgi:hypothetical protein